MEDEQLSFTLPADSNSPVIKAVWHPPTSRATKGAIIVLPSPGYTKDHWLNVDLCVGAAVLGLTAVRFDSGEDISKFPLLGVMELVKIINYLKKFGKETSSERYYLICKSTASIAALNFALIGVYGIVAFGMPLYSKNRKDSPLAHLFNIQSHLLVVQGEYDPFGSPQEVDTFLKMLPVSSHLEIIKEVGHDFEPVPVLADSQEQAEVQRQNLSTVIQITLDWLEKQEGLWANKSR